MREQREEPGDGLKQTRAGNPPTPAPATKATASETPNLALAGAIDKAGGWRRWAGPDCSGWVAEIELEGDRLLVVIKAGAPSWARLEWWAPGARVPFTVPIEDIADGPGAAVEAAAAVLFDELGRYKGQPASPWAVPRRQAA